MTDFRAEHHLATIDADGALCDVIVRFSYDGLEHIGRLWFAGPAVNDKQIPDHGAIPGRTIDSRGQATEISTKGRHDPCVGIRAVPIAEAMLALVLMDHYLRQRGQNADVSPKFTLRPLLPGSD